jgi:hypothetical protein
VSFTNLETRFARNNTAIYGILTSIGVGIFTTEAVELTLIEFSATRELSLSRKSNRLLGFSLTGDEKTIFASNSS